jgi:hypothetical protein
MLTACSLQLLTWSMVVLVTTHRTTTTRRFVKISLESVISLLGAHRCGDGLTIELVLALRRMTLLGGEWREPVVAPVTARGAARGDARARARRMPPGPSGRAPAPWPLADRTGMLVLDGGELSRPYVIGAW